VKTERDSIVKVGWNRNTTHTIETTIALFKSKLFPFAINGMKYLRHTRLNATAAIRITGSNK